MSNLENLNPVQLVKGYLSSIGMSDDTISKYFDENHFNRALILNLPSVCLMPQNKPGASKSNQTHIHVTGDPRHFFFPSEEVANRTSASKDERIDIDVSLANIKALHKNSASISPNDLEIKRSFTLAKIAHRRSQENQVQISKIKLDDSLFIDLRLGLYKNDLLVFLGYSDSDRLFAIGIPKEYYSSVASVGTSVFFNLHDTAKIQIKSALKRIEASYDDNEMISDMEAIADSIYQQQIVEAEPSVTQHAPMPKAGKVTSLSERSKRSAAIGKEAIKDGDYKCAIDSSHLTFQSKNGSPYVEAHHLIPMAFEDDFENSLDVKGNIVPLCPHCHAKIHYGKFDDVSNMIEQLYSERKDVLALSGIGIDLETLKKYYL
ncbi:MAG: hypothetical protein GT589_01050 [Peptoclostridium sp.]|uniref:HNH endonuclease n=1 Tax=Peptoclostridium sp. TaxID=1904860 RepID=UPI00139B5116|nr:HNH endonuclease [Peptoclostridium sp.]MZQ74731.1 hypothetical protein [Peptoclostridium sp.]